MLDKTYRPEEVETRLYDAWEKAGAFACGQNDNKPFSIVIPPPNVTGSLHMGHALNNTLQDILIRFERMRGRDVLWQPGTDHAGIATQMVVERQLEQFQQTRRSLGREKFLEKVWEWKAESGGTITRQLRRLGASCDWSRERFTMDDGLSAAVRKVFVELHRQGLIYKDKRLVNWDIKFQTAISDLEVEAREVKGNLWHIAYPVEGSDERITVATTRPETMLGDSGIAVHPDDERFRHLVGRHAILPLVGRRIPIVADAYSDPEKGTGAVKMTPAHDFNDFEVGKRHGLDMIVVLDREGRISDAAPEAYRNLTREEARKRVVADLEEQGYLVKVEPHVHTVPHGDRSGLVIEPYLTDQWYVDAATLAKPAIAAVETGAMTFVPRQWEKTYFEWMRNIQPWCISRQLWWGHQIPAWYAPDGKVFVAETEAEAQGLADAHYGQPTVLVRDEDVLDTWFSSALWPFSTLGWPEKTKELDRYYQTDVVVTGFDIIFFWVARMAMMGLHFMGEAPFHTIYIHALVRDEKGQKMSKSKGNVIDPLVLIDKYGADAMRFTLTAMAAQGRDIKLAESRVEGYRNFCTKLWNASRFAEMNGCDPVAGFDPAAVTQTVNRWIVGATVRCGAAVTQAIEAYRYNEAAGVLYQFAWGTYCDWYLEFIKPVLMGADGPAKDETRATCAWVLERLLELMHPIMPFVTEELWQRRYRPVTGGTFLMQRPWPDFSSLPVDQAAFDEMEWVIRLISEVRTARNEMNVPAAAKIPLFLNGASGLSQARLATHRDAILRLARLEDAATDGQVGQGAVQIVLDEATVVLPLADVIDIAKERERLAKEKAKAEAEIAKIDGRMANADFVAKAPAHVLEENNERKVNFSATIARLDEALKRLA